jgi:hypothetical protein
MRGQTVCAVNDAAIRLYPLRQQFASLSVFSLDSVWVNKNCKFLADFDGEKFVALPLDTFPECDGIPGVTYLQWSTKPGLSDDPGVICTGGNSGYGALNLAYLKKARYINLVGYDMHPADKPHFPIWSAMFQEAVPQLRKNGVLVLNFNPHSNIHAFPKVPR